MRRPGAPFGTRREIKNLNSFRFMQQAIDYEVRWQIELIEDGGTVAAGDACCSTPTRGETRAMRSKEDAHDYRYFPDPDLPPLVIAPDWIERVRAEMPELPRAMAERFVQRLRPAGVRRGDADAEQGDGALLRSARRDGAAASAKLAANWLMGEVSRRLNAAGVDIDASAGARRRRLAR